MRKALLTGIALAALATMGACSPSDGGNTDLTIVDKQAGDPKWTPFVDDFIAGWFRLDPGFAVYQRSEEHTSELQSLMRISYAVFCLKKKKKKYSTYQNRRYHKSNKQI